MQISEMPRDELLQELGSRPGGLTEAEAEDRLRQHGPNEIREVRRAPLALKLLANFYHTFALLLWAAGVLAFVADMAELGWAIIAVIFINAGFSFWQENRAEKAVEALKKILPAKARVIRGGSLEEVLARDLVPGDIIVLAEGDYISADSRLLDENDLRVNAATLTGESEPVRKLATPTSAEGMTPGEIPNLVLTGTSVAFGSGKAVVYATGMETEFGKIASLTQTVKVELSPLQKEVNRVALVIAAVAIIMGATLFGVSSLFTQLSMGAAAVFAIGMLVANVPEGLLPTVTLALAMAVKRMAGENALVKQLSGVETLGSTTVICTDKTGTLTQNEMTVRHLWADGQIVDVGGIGYEPTGDFSSGGAALAAEELAGLGALMASAALCNNARLVEPESSGTDRSKGDAETGAEGRWGIVGDPTEAALLVAARKEGFDEAAELEQNPRLQELPFDSRRKRMSVIHGVRPEAIPDTAGDDGCRWALVKGAPNEVLSLSSRILSGGGEKELTDEQKAEITAANDDMARSGLRVLAMAYRCIGPDTEITAEAIEQDLVFTGLMAMMDPPREEVAAAVASCHEAGIRVIMITGDYGLTAESIARRIGIIGQGPARIVNGAELEAVSDSDLGKLLDNENLVFARVSPEHKLMVAAALKEGGQIVAMTGDGVNDAPALKQADIGVAMGITGTDVAKEAATMILTDDNFSTIVTAVEAGRVVYDNMKKFLAYIFAHLTPEIVPFVLFVLFDVPLPITVMQILAIDLGTETLPALALGVEKGEPDMMKRPPRSRRDRLVDRHMLFHAWMFLGLIEAVLVLAGFFWVLYAGGWHWGQQLDENSHLYLQATTMTWAGIIALQVGTAFACRTNRTSVFGIGFWSNRWLLWGIAFELLFTLLIVYVPWLQSIFQTTGLDPEHWLLLATFPPVIFTADELRKLIIRRRSRD